jgi:hypothetical protein
MALTLLYVFCSALKINRTFTLYIINRLAFITEVDSVYCTICAHSLYKTDHVSSLKG